MCPLALKRQVAIHPGFVVSAAAVMPAMAVIVVMVAYHACEYGSCWGFRKLFGVYSVSENILAMRSSFSIILCLILSSCSQSSRRMWSSVTSSLSQPQYGIYVQPVNIYILFIIHVIRIIRFFTKCVCLIRRIRYCLCRLPAN